MARFLTLLVGGYQRFLSPFKIRAHCIYTSARSQYAIEALKKYDALRSTWLARKRILRCHPFVEGGYGPAPQRLGGICIE